MPIRIAAPSSGRGAPHEIVLSREGDGRLKVWVRTTDTKDPEHNGYDAIVSVPDLLIGIGRAMNGEADN
jgi:hypothetical protein